MVSDVGFMPAQALRAATTDPARSMKVENVQGSIEEGRNAHLVLLSRNPLVDIRSTRAIDAVVLRGRFLDRAELDGFLVQAANASRE